MKLLVFAHIPPPHHGQSYMVKLMLDGLGGDFRKGARRTAKGDRPAIECFHVNARFSDDMEDIGTFRIGKALLVLRYCVEAVWCRFRYGVRAFYYVPAPGKRAALYRDWMVMILCRPFFRDFIHHWHAAGLGDWLRSDGNFFERWLTHRLLGKPTLGLVLAISNMRDPLWFRSERTEVVVYGIPDPCVDFDRAVLPVRRRRLAARKKLLAGEPVAADEEDAAVLRILYIAHCTRQKGVFDALEGVILAQRRLAATSSPLRLHLTIAGAFLDAAEEREFRDRLAQPDCAGLDSFVTYAGFVSGGQKAALFHDSDCLCFPTYYHAESFGLVVIEAMATGMEVITTRWRALPDILPPDYPGFIAPRSPEAVATALLQALTFDHARELRSQFVTRFTESCYLRSLSAALSGHAGETKTQANP